MGLIFWMYSMKPDEVQEKLIAVNISKKSRRWLINSLLSWLSHSSAQQPQYNTSVIPYSERPDRNIVKIVYKTKYFPLVKETNITANAQQNQKERIRSKCSDRMGALKGSRREARDRDDSSSSRMQIQRGCTAMKCRWVGGGAHDRTAESCEVEKVLILVRSIIDEYIYHILY